MYILNFFREKFYIMCEINCMNNTFIIEYIDTRAYKKSS